MKKKLARIFFLTVCLLMILSVSAGAIVPYTTYTYNVSGIQQNSPHAYVPQQVISSASIKQGLANRVNEIASDKYGENFLDLQAIYDICVDDLGHVYIVDSGSASTAGSGRIICLDENYNLRLVINEFVNDQGVPDSFSEPKGVFVTDTEILVADSGKARIVIFDKVGNFKTIVPEPASDVFPEASVYTPVAVATDAGRAVSTSSPRRRTTASFRSTATVPSTASSPAEGYHRRMGLFLAYVPDCGAEKVQCSVCPDRV